LPWGLYSNVFFLTNHIPDLRGKMISRVLRVPRAKYRSLKAAVTSSRNSAPLRENLLRVLGDLCGKK
ncbi:MAG TPA: hypothetical protein P5555_20500, partial [Candidatus Paceibacterota bacterium]|nr:hypothetical protein [Verrucomicrobiota bacterium]HRZ47563.1 hypothetical protein [Candidatus Paceibacterota bacterium]